MDIFMYAVFLAIVGSGCVESHAVPPCPYSHDASKYVCDGDAGK